MYNGWLRLALDFFDELKREMWNLRRGSLEPLVIVSETEDKVIIEGDLPLVKKKDIRLRLSEDGLEVEASFTKYVQFKRWGTVQRSCEFRSFYKLVPLPSQIDPESVKATFKRGILRVELKKRKKKDYRITIQ
jgi:HSP20 family protein